MVAPTCFYNPPSFQLFLKVLVKAHVGTSIAGFFITQRGAALRETFNILIGDRNPNVRELLRKTLAAEGYRVWVAKDGTEVLMILEAKVAPDLLIMDMDIHRVNRLRISEWFKDHDSSMPLLLHKAHAFFEQSCNDVAGFKAVVAGVLRECYPDRFDSFERGNRLLAQEEKVNTRIGLSSIPERRSSCGGQF
jgi:CheY-like chemotaxis protein